MQQELATTLVTSRTVSTPVVTGWCKLPHPKDSFNLDSGLTNLGTMLLIPATTTGRSPDVILGLEARVYAISCLLAKCSTIPKTKSQGTPASTAMSGQWPRPSRPISCQGAPSETPSAACPGLRTQVSKPFFISRVVEHHN